jgi:hypothetical protein
MIPSIDDQISAMAETWPGFELVGRDGDMAHWRGVLRPLLQRYEVQILYRAPKIIEKLDARTHQPRVRASLCCVQHCARVKAIRKDAYRMSIIARMATYRFACSIPMPETGRLPT